MPVSGLVLLTRPESSLEPLLAALAAHPDLAPGAPIERRVPLVLDTRDRDHDRAVWAWLRARPEVLDVAVALVHDGDPAPGGPARGGPARGGPARGGPAPGAPTEPAPDRPRKPLRR